MTNPDLPQPSALLFCGDPHGQFEQVLLAASLVPEAPVVLLGDLQPREPLAEVLAPIWSRVWWIPGNHDTDDEAEAQCVFHEQAAPRSLQGRVVEVAPGLRVAGLGGVFRGQVWYPRTDAAPRFDSPTEHARSVPKRDRWRDGPPRKHWSTIYPAQIRALAAQRCEVLVLHEAPGYHPHGFDVLDDLARSMRARLVVHGHQHDHLDSRARWAEQGFASFGVGLRGVALIDLEGHCEMVVAGELDEQRSGRV